MAIYRSKYFARFICLRGSKRGTERKRDGIIVTPGYFISAIIIEFNYILRWSLTFLSLRKYYFYHLKYLKYVDCLINFESNKTRMYIMLLSISTVILLVNSICDVTYILASSVTVFQIWRIRDAQSAWAGDCKKASPSRLTHIFGQNQKILYCNVVFLSRYTWPIPFPVPLFSQENRSNSIKSCKALVYDGYHFVISREFFSSQLFLYVRK